MHLLSQSNTVFFTLVKFQKLLNILWRRPALISTSSGARTFLKSIAYAKTVFSSLRSHMGRTISCVGFASQFCWQSSRIVRWWCHPFLNTTEMIPPLKGTDSLSLKPLSDNWIIQNNWCIIIWFKVPKSHDTVVSPAVRIDSEKVQSFLTVSNGSEASAICNGTMNVAFLSGRQFCKFGRLAAINEFISFPSVHGQAKSYFHEGKSKNSLFYRFPTLNLIQNALFRFPSCRGWIQMENKSRCDMTCHWTTWKA